MLNNPYIVVRRRAQRLASRCLLVALASVTVLIFAGAQAEPLSAPPPHADESFLQGRMPYYVRYAPGRSDAVEQAVTARDGRVTQRLDRVESLAVLLAEPAAEALASRKDVVLVEPVPQHRLAGQVVPYNIDQYQARDIWDADRDGLVDPNAPNGSKVKFCIIDSGLYAAHDDFAGVTISGFSQIDGEEWFEDGNGHGTHVAGTANAVHNDIGVVGTMPGGAELIILKVFNNNGQWVTGQSNLGAAAQTCRDMGANVLSMSLGGGSSSTENAIFQDLYDNFGILNIAAAGNSDGPGPDPYTAPSYPANYDSVISVAAIDSAEVAAPFTQHPDTSYDPNNPPANVEWDVAELSGGGVNVLSTWPGPPHGVVPNYQVSINGITYQGAHMEESGLGDVTGPLVDGGLCDSAGSWSGAIVICERGSIAFADKINNVRDGGGLGAVIYNNVAGELLGTCGGNCTTPLIPAIGITQADGQELVSTALGDSANLIADDGTGCTDCTGSYNAISGTSMATPGVAAAVALTWDACGGPAGLTNKQIRQLLRDSAKDLSGTHPDTGLVYGSGWDRVTGWGLVQLNDARELGNQLYGSTCPIGLQASPSTLEVCGATDDSAETTITLDDAFEGSATMSANGVPAGASGNFSPNPVVHPTKDTVLTLNGLDGVTSGSYAIEAIATDDSDATNTATGYLTLELDAALPGQATLQSPANGSTGLPLQPTLSWASAGDASEYLVEIATDSAFSSIVHSATVSGTSHDVPAALNTNSTHYWRVTAANLCGNGAVSSTFNFTTESVVQVCSTPNLAIPDNDPVGVSDPLSVTASENITDVNVYLRGTHTWVGDLGFNLTHPDGTTQAIVVDRPGVPTSTFGCSADDFDLWLDDEGTDGAVEDQCAGSPPALFGSATPNEALSVFDGLTANGNWTCGSLSGSTFTTAAVTADCTVTASFAINTYTLTYTAGANGLISGDSPQTVDHGSDGTQVEAVPDANYHFVQWSDGNTANPRTDTNVTGDITVEAEFAIDTYTLTYTAGANGSISGSSPQTVDHGSGGTQVEAVPDANYHFVQWSDGSTSNPRTDTNVTADITVEAEFAIDTYTLTYTAGANGSISGSSPQTVDHGSDGTQVEAVPDANYHFVQWSDGSTANPRTDTNVTADVTVEAEFAIDSYTVTFVDHDGAELKIETVNHGEGATAPADPTREGYTFTGWDVPFDNVTSDLTVTAQYEINTYTVTFVDHDGSELKSETVEHGSAATAPADPTRPGYIFTGWDVSFDSVTSDLTVTAQYEAAEDAVFADRFEDSSP